MQTLRNMKQAKALVLIVIVLLASSVSYAQSTPKPLIAPNVANSSPDAPENFVGMYGAIHYGPEFGLSMTAENFSTFQSHALAIQAVLSGQADIVASLVPSTLLVNEAGQNFKIFCIRNAKSNAVLIGQPGFTKLEQMLNPQTRIALDSPGGYAQILMNVLFQAHGIDQTTNDLSNVRILESTDARAAALVASEVDATIVSLSSAQQIQKERPDMVIIASVVDIAPLYLSNVYAAPAKWLDEHLDVATAFCASVIKAQRELYGDFNRYVEAVKKSLSKPPSEESLKIIWDFLTQKDSWNLKAGLQKDSVEFVAKVLVKSRTLKSMPNVDDIIDLRPYEGALKLLPPFDMGATMQPTGDAAATANP